MEKNFVVMLTSKLAEYIGPEYFASETEAKARLEAVKAALKDPSAVKLMKLIEV